MPAVLSSGDDKKRRAVGREVGGHRMAGRGYDVPEMGMKKVSGKIRRFITERKCNVVVMPETNPSGDSGIAASFAGCGIQRISAVRTVLAAHRGTSKVNLPTMHDSLRL
mgnify:CR=1 FL=1